MRIAIIDLGTNTFNILIVEVDGNRDTKQLFQTKIPVKLGEGGINKGFIAPIPFQRGIDALVQYKLIIEEYSVDKTFAFATSAIRSANNGIDFVNIAKEKTGIEVQVISGDKEAELIYYGVRSAVKMSNDTSLIIDIGGGSTEFIIANKDQIFWKQSFLLGAARLLEIFNPSDPITDKEIETIKNYLRQELQSLLDAVKKYPITELIGSSGSFDSLAEMIAHRFYTPEILKNITEYEFKLDDCSAIYDIIIKSTKAERTAMKGLVLMRVDMMVISSILVHFVLSELETKKMRLSTYSLKEGVLWEVMNNNQ
ncbi:MAG: phosphatase [Bacteroidetes bacterium]|nr:phosphatase [Bacteroidota bacterium]